MKFKPGQIMVTSSISEEIQEGNGLHLFVHACVSRHLDGDWGDACAEDKASNEAALKNGDRLFSVYKSEEFGVLWVVTESDRSVITCLRPEDY